VEAKKIVLTPAANSAIFVRSAIKESCLSGGSAHGVTDRDLFRKTLPARRKCTITLSAKPVEENLCDLCVIVPGAIAKFDNPGMFVPSLNYVDGATGLLIQTFGITAHGVNRT
jgi:hypothetical protein